MKKFFILFLCVTVIFTFAACNVIYFEQSNGVADNGGNDDYFSENDNLGDNDDLDKNNGGADAGNNDASNGADLTQDENTSSATTKYIRSSTNGLKVRVLPSSTATSIGTLDKNDMVVYIGSVDGWYETVYMEKKAYVYASYCTIVKIENENEKVENAISVASALLGYPYVWGSQRYHWGNGVLNSNFVRGEFDCSAFTQYIYYISNKTILGTTTRTQVLQGKEISRNNIKRGDLMFFTNASRYNNTGIERVGHVAIYLGDNYILHTASDHAVIEPISETRWSYYIDSRRVL